MTCLAAPGRQQLQMQPIFSTTPRALTNRATVVPYTQCCPPPSQKSQGSSGLSGSPSDRHSRPQAQTFLHIHGQALKAPSQPPAPQEEKAEEQSAITTWCSRSQNIPPLIMAGQGQTPAGHRSLSPSWQRPRCSCATNSGSDPLQTKSCHHWGFMGHTEHQGDA